MNINIKAPNFLDKKLTADKVSIYKSKMGASSRTDNIIYCNTDTATKAFFIGILSTIVSKYCVLSFEKSGILVIGLGITGHFNGKNAFIPKRYIRNIDVKQMVSVVLIIKSRAGNVRFVAPLFGAPFQKSNLQNIDQLTKSEISPKLNSEYEEHKETNKNKLRSTEGNLQLIISYVLAFISCFLPIVFTLAVIFISVSVSNKKKTFKYSVVPIMISVIMTIFGIWAIVTQ